MRKLNLNELENINAGVSEILDIKNINRNDIIIFLRNLPDELQLNNYTDQIETILKDKNLTEEELQECLKTISKWIENPASNNRTITIYISSKKLQIKEEFPA